MEATIGGTRRHLVDVSAAQLARGLEVHLAVASLRDPDFPADLEHLRRLGARVYELPMVREIRPLQDLRDFRSLCRILREARPDIVHTHSSKAGVLGRAASIWTGIGARVHTPHTFAFLFGALFGKHKRRLFRWLEAMLARRTSLVLAVSPTEAETFVSSGVVPVERIRVVCNGIDPARFEDVGALELAPLGLDPSRPLAAVVGLVYAAKGQDLALEALSMPGCEALQLLLAGPGELQETRARIVRLGLEPRVRVLGARRDVPSLLAALDFLILPSRWEGMPYIVLEAMASGLPVVATPVDGARDLIVDGETGLLAASIDPAALAASIAELLSMSPEQRARMGARGRERLLRDYSLEHMLEGLEGAYRDALAGSRAPRPAAETEGSRA